MRIDQDWIKCVVGQSCLTSATMLLFLLFRTVHRIWHLSVLFGILTWCKQVSCTYIYSICKFLNVLICVLYNWWNLALLSWHLRPDGGGWSTKGCTFISSLNNSTSCSCNHTTNFALLLQIAEVQVRY